MAESLQDVLDGVGAIMRQLREDAGLTQKQAAALADSAACRVSDLELGKTDLKVSTLLKWANAYGHELWIFITPPEETINEKESTHD